MASIVTRIVANRNTTAVRSYTLLSHAAVPRAHERAAAAIVHERSQARKWNLYQSRRSALDYAIIVKRLL